MKRLIAVVVLACALTTLTGCVTGPFRLSRTWDDHYNQKYTESAWLHGVLLNNIIPFYGIVGLFAWVGDAVFVNTWHFWAHDAWDNNGTGFNHKDLQGAARSVTGCGF